MLQAYVVHAVPGRARIKLPGKRGDGLFFSQLETWLRDCPGVAQVQINCRAASALIGFTPDGNLAQVARQARQHRVFKLENNPPPLKTVGEIFSDQLGQVNHMINTGSRGHLDSNSIFFLLFLALGVKQLWRGNIMQPAIPLLWRALEVLRDMNGNVQK